MMILFPLLMLFAVLAALGKLSTSHLEIWPTVGPDRFTGWPRGWNQPPPGYWNAVAKWSAAYRVPAYLILVLTRRESNFIPTANGAQTERVIESFRRYDKRKMPGSDILWGDIYKLPDWHAYGLLQLMPFTIIGVPAEHGGLAAGDSLKDAYDVDRNIHLGCYWLARLHAKYGTWEKALRVYGSGKPDGGEAGWLKFVRFMGELRPYLK